MTIPPLDEDAMTAAYDVLARDHGKLDGLAVWLAGVQGAMPPRPLARRRVVVFGASPLAGDVRGDGSYDDGAALADAEVDAGADVFVVAGGRTYDTPALVAALADAEPTEVAPRGTAWSRDVAAIRDARRAHRDASPVELAAAFGAAAVAGFLVTAARRRTPVVLDGAGAAAGALVAAAVEPGSAAYFAAGHLTPHPAHRVALTALGLEPLLDLGIAADGGGLLALPLLDAAVELLAQRR